MYIEMVPKSDQWIGYGLELASKYLLKYL